MVWTELFTVFCCCGGGILLLPSELMTWARRCFSMIPLGLIKFPGVRRTRRLRPHAVMAVGQYCQLDDYLMSLSRGPRRTMRIQVDAAFKAHGLKLNTRSVFPIICVQFQTNSLDSHEHRCHFHTTWACQMVNPSSCIVDINVLLLCFAAACVDRPTATSLGLEHLKV